MNLYDDNLSSLIFTFYLVSWLEFDEFLNGARKLEPKCLMKVVWWKICSACSSDIVFQLQVIYKSYRQVPIPVNNSQLFLKLKILDKLRLVTFHKMATQRKCNIITGWYQFRRNESSHDLDSKSIEMKMLVA
jgi:hypothetical protein